MTKELKIEPSSYPCHILAADFDTGIVSIQMLGDNYKVSSGIKYLSNTHPVKELTLTEDEIDDVWAACSTGESEFIDMHLFAEAIIRKAQEK